MPRGIANDQHAFVDSGRTLVSPKGRTYHVCETCGKIRLGMTHTPLGRVGRRNDPINTGEAARAMPRPRIVRAQEPEPEPDIIEPSWQGVQTALVGLGNVLKDALKTAEQAGRAAATAPPAAGPPAPEIGVWQLDLLMIAVDRALAMPPGSVSKDITDDLELLRRHLRVKADTYTAPYQNGAGGPSTGVLQPSRVSHGAITSPVASGKARRLIGGIRNAEVKELVRYAVSLGWEASPTGSGHLRLTNPENAARSFVVSMTVTDAGRSLDNMRAQARRAGLEVLH